MAHITTEQVADIRARLKAAFPAKDGWKLSVRKEHHSSVHVVFVAGPHNFEAWAFDPYSQESDAPKSRQHAEAMESTKAVTCGSVNHYYIAEHYLPESAKILQKASDIIHRDHWDDSDIQSDYFHCAFYVTMEIGKWNKPYEVTK